MFVTPGIGVPHPGAWSIHYRCLPKYPPSEHSMRHIPTMAVALFLAFASQPGIQGGDAVKAVNLEKLNTAGDEEDPFPTPDDSSLLYVAKVKGSYKVHVSTKTSKGFIAGKPFKLLAADK